MSEQLYKRVVRTDGHNGHLYDYEPVDERTCEGCKHENKSKLNWPCVICTHINRLDYYEVSE